jgi:hypothetical protein
VENAEALAERLLGLGLALATALVAILFAVGVVTVEVAVGTAGSYAALLGGTYLRDRGRLTAGAKALRRVEQMLEIGDVRVHAPGWQPDHVALLQQARSVRAVGLALQVLAGLGKEAVREQLRQVVARGGTVELILSDPRCEQLGARWADEGAHQFTRQTLSRQLCDVLAIPDTLPSNEQERFSIRLFNSYPTFCVLRTDRILYAFIYVFGTSGRDSPVIEVDAESESPLKAFFDTAVQRLAASAVSASDVRAAIEQLAGMRD